MQCDIPIAGVLQAVVPATKDGEVGRCSGTVWPGNGVIEVGTRGLTGRRAATSREAAGDIARANHAVQGKGRPIPGLDQVGVCAR
jgi:hypothetical protein